MRSIYLIISFIAATVVFFYFVNSLTLTINLSGTDTTPKPNEGYLKTEGTLRATTTRNFTPNIFNGPTGQPHIIGPQGPPPNY